MKPPLFIVTGASGTGKTAVVPYLQRLLPMCDVFDMDIILDETDWRISHRNWFRFSASLAEQGRCTVLCGTVIPEHLVDYKEIEAVATVYFINLHCDDAIREARLTARGWPADLIENHRDFARWLLAYAGTAFDPPLETIDTVANTVDEVAAYIQQWVLAHLAQSDYTDAPATVPRNSERVLFLVTGTCGAGKTTMVPFLKQLLPQCDVFDGDIITSGVEWQGSQQKCLRIAKSLVEQGRHVVLCKLAIPEHLQDYEELKAFSTICYFNLHCDDATRQVRLEARGFPQELIDGHHEFARWLLANAGTAFDPPMACLDATRLTPEESASAIRQWVLAHIQPDQG